MREETLAALWEGRKLWKEPERWGDLESSRPLLSSTISRRASGRGTLGTHSGDPGGAQLEGLRVGGARGRGPWCGHRVGLCFQTHAVPRGSSSGRGRILKNCCGAQAPNQPWLWDSEWQQPGLPGSLFSAPPGLPFSLSLTVSATELSAWK